MTEFFSLLCSPDVSFLRFSLLAALLSGVAFGIVGSVVVVRRLSSLAGAIAHASLGGVGAALYCQRGLGWSWCLPLYGALAAAVLASIVIGTVSLWANEREDTVIGGVWALGMGIGLLFMTATPGYVDLQGYLFGNILLLGSREVLTILVLDAAVILLVLFFFHNIVATAFDPGFASLRGISVKAVYFLILILTALTIVLMVNVAGVILVIALLTLPAASAGLCVKGGIAPMMTVGAIFSCLCSGGSIAAGYAWDLPSGPLAVLFASGLYFLLLLLRKRVWQ